MTEEQFDRWATNSSTRTAPTSGLKATGYTKGSQPSNVNWNWLVGELIDKVNDIIRHGPSGLSEDTGLDTLASATPNVFARYYPKSDTATWDSAGGYGSPERLSYALGATKPVVAICPWYDIVADVQKILCLEGDTSRNIIEFDKINWSVSSSGDIGGSNLPSGSSETWVPQAMCTDGTYVYVTFKDTNVTPNETHRIQAYDPSDWSVKSGWPSTGVAISGTGTSANAWEFGDVRVVNETKIAVTCPWTSYAAAPTDKLIAVYQISDGTLLEEGAGSCTSGYPITLTSTGTDIFFVTSADRLERATIGTVGVAPATYPWAGFSDIMDCMCVGNAIYSSSTFSTAILGVHSTSEDEICKSTQGDDRICFTGGRMEFDGACVWMRGTVKVNATEKVALFKLDTNSASIESAGTPYAMPNIEDVVKTTIITDPLATVVDYYQAMAPICFDGRDIWYIGDVRGTSQPLSGILYRVPKAVLR